MTPLAIFLLGCATVFLGAVQAAFSALMRLSLRLMAERGGKSDRLAHYLDDPLQLFVPLRLLLGICIVAAGVLIARVSDIHNATSVAVFVVSLIAFVVVCEHLLPMLIVRRDPEQALATAGLVEGLWLSQCQTACHPIDQTEPIATSMRRPCLSLNTRQGMEGECYSTLRVAETLLACSRHAARERGSPRLHPSA